MHPESFGIISGTSQLERLRVSVLRDVVKKLFSHVEVNLERIEAHLLSQINQVQAHLTESLQAQRNEQQKSNENLAKIMELVHPEAAIS